MSLNFAAPDRLLARYQRSGDPRALGRLFDRTAPELLRVAVWLCGNRADAEDVLQRTFVTVIETRGAFDAKKRALPWLCGIVGNHARKVHEQRQRRVAPAGQRGGERTGERDPAHAAADAELAATVARLRQELGSPYAEVLDLHFGEGLNSKEIAARLGRPAGTVRTQLVRALALLRRQLPAGFAAGLALSATATASSLATVRAAVVPGGAAAVTSFTFGGLLMGKKIAVVVPALLLLLGSGAWALVDADGAAPVREKAPPFEVAGVERRTQAGRPDEPPAPAALRGAVDAANDVAPDADTATLVVRALWQHDGAPAAGIGVTVSAQQPRLRLFDRDGLTGDDGRVVVRGIRPASYAVASPYSDVSCCELAAGSVTAIDLKVRCDAVVRGIVVDGDDRPVPDARLWLSDRATWERGFEVARSDANGRFELPLRGDHYAGARKAGHAPSRLRHLWPVPTSDVTLRLSSRGGAIRGRVVGTDGAAIAGAIVAVGQDGGRVVAGGTIAERQLQPTPEALRTDADGAFFADGVASGATEVRAWAADHGNVLQRVEVAIGRTSDVVLTLPRGATIEGVVRDDKQRPVANARIMVGDSLEFGAVRSESDAQGRFRLEHLSPGDVELLAELDPAYAFVRLRLAPGEVATCHPVLATKQLAGTLVGPEGAPIAGYTVGTFADGAPVESAVTDAAGRFVLAGMRGPAVDLVVSVHGIGIAQREDVAVGATDLVLRLLAAEVPSASIRGRIVDERGKGLPSAVSVMNAATSFATRVEADLDGEFVCTALPAGTWWLSIDGHPLGSVRLPPVEVSAGENRVLADVVLSPPGRVELLLRGADVTPGGLVMFVRDDGTETRVMSPDGRRVAGELTAGGYTALAQAGDLAGAVSFTVRPGQTIHGELVLAPSVPVAAEFRVEPSPQPGETLRTIARDAAGNVVAAGILDFRVRQPDGAPRLRFRVPPGPCVLETRHSGGRTVTTAFTAGRPGAKEQGVVVALQAK